MKKCNYGALYFYILWSIIIISKKIINYKEGDIIFSSILNHLILISLIGILSSYCWVKIAWLTALIAILFYIFSFIFIGILSIFAEYITQFESKCLNDGGMCKNICSSDNIINADCIGNRSCCRN